MGFPLQPHQTILRTIHLVLRFVHVLVYLLERELVDLTLGKAVETWALTYNFNPRGKSSRIVPACARAVHSRKEAED